MTKVSKKWSGGKMVWEKILKKKKLQINTDYTFWLSKQRNTQVV